MIPWPCLLSDLVWPSLIFNTVDNMALYIICVGVLISCRSKDSVKLSSKDGRTICHFLKTLKNADTPLLHRDTHLAIVCLGLVPFAFSLVISCSLSDNVALMTTFLQFVSSFQACCPQCACDLVISCYLNSASLSFVVSLHQGLNLFLKII